MTAYNQAALPDGNVSPHQLMFGTTPRRLHSEQLGIPDLTWHTPQHRWQEAEAQRDTTVEAREERLAKERGRFNNALADLPPELLAKASDGEAIGETTYETSRAPSAAHPDDLYPLSRSASSSGHTIRRRSGRRTETGTPSCSQIGSALSSSYGG